MGINFEYYKVFYYVAKYQNITVAAQKLFLSQSTVSRIIQNLEYELDSVLFSRSRKGVALTEAGKMLFQHVEPACDQIFNGEKCVISRKKTEKEIFRIGTTEMIMQYFLVPVLKKFRKQFPFVKLDISFYDPSTVGAAFHADMIDIAILTTPLERDERIESFSWTEFEEWVLAGNDWNELKGGSYSWKNLKKLPFLGMRNGMSEMRYAASVFKKENITIEPVCEVGSMPLLLDLLAENFGLAMAPEFYARELLGCGKCFRVNLEKELPKREVCVVMKKDGDPNMFRQAFFEIIINEPGRRLYEL